MFFHPARFVTNIVQYLDLDGMSLLDAGHCCSSKEKDRADQSGHFLVN